MLRMDAQMPRAQATAMDGGRYDSRDGGGTTTWMWKVEQRMEQLPRAASGIAAESNAGAVAEMRGSDRTVGSVESRIGAQVHPTNNWRGFK